MPSLDSIDTYMARLHALILDSPHEHETLIQTVREIVGRLNFDACGGGGVPAPRGGDKSADLVE